MTTVNPATASPGEHDIAQVVREAVAAALAVPRPLALKVKDAAATLGVSEDYFARVVAPDIRMYRDGRMKLVPVRELDRWLEQNVAYALGDR